MSSGSLQSTHALIPSHWVSNYSYVASRSVQRTSHHDNRAPTPPQAIQSYCQISTALCTAAEAVLSLDNIYKEIPSVPKTGEDPTSTTDDLFHHLTSNIQVYRSEALTHVKTGLWCFELMTMSRSCVIQLLISARSNCLHVHVALVLFMAGNSFVGKAKSNELLDNNLTALCSVSS